MKNSSYILLLASSWIIWWALNYMYHPLLLRYLSVEEFWTFQSLFWIFNIFSVIIISLSIYLVKEIIKDTSKESLLQKQHLLRLDLVKLSAFMLLVFFIFSAFINWHLNINNYYYFLFLSISILFINLELYIFPFLQALRKFETMSLLRLIAPILRIITWVWLVYLWYWIYGAIWGFVASQALFIIIWYKYMRRYIPYQAKNQNNSGTFLFKNISNLKYFFIASIILTLFQNIDILIVKSLFDSETTGYYAAISVLAKFLIFLGLSIETVYYPQLVKESSLPTLQLLRISWYYIIMTLWAIVFFILFGETILRLFKDGLQEYLWLIYPLIIYCGLLAYLSIIVKTLIAFERYTINYLLWALIVWLIVSLYSLWDTPLLVTQIFALFGLVGLGLGMSQLYVYKNTWTTE